MGAVPKTPVTLMAGIYTKVLPEVHNQLNRWKRRAESIPDPELRKQALASIQTKTFHCEGGSIYGILAGRDLKTSIEFITAYQTISDYLDNLCDRSTSQDADDFTALHESMLHALTPGAPTADYYRHRAEQNDGGYLKSLVLACQNSLAQVPHYEMISPMLYQLADYYCDLQVHKHVHAEERVPRLEAWFEKNKSSLPEMTWYEFSACAGSTLGIFCLVSYGFKEEFTEEQARKVMNGYFPYIQGLHILLDYFIDQEEDRDGGDLNFCFYYPHDGEMLERFKHFIREADKHTDQLPNRQFHRMINKGLLGIYLSDQKVGRQHSVNRIARKMIKCGGHITRFFYVNGKLYRRVARNGLSKKAKKIPSQ